jgi:putative multiple sugar transport system substrate-binding protein
MKIKSVLTGIALGLGVTLMSISAQVSAQSKALVGVAMPTKSSARWIADGNNMVKVLKERVTRPTCNTPKTTSPTSCPRSRT